MNQIDTDKQDNDTHPAEHDNKPHTTLPPSPKSQHKTVYGHTVADVEQQISDWLAATKDST